MVAPRCLSSASALVADWLPEGCCPILSAPEVPRGMVAVHRSLEPGRWLRTLSSSVPDDRFISQGRQTSICFHHSESAPGKVDSSKHEAQGRVGQSPATRTLETPASSQ
ncbi:hypothetical protein TREES_T100002568 [Tupaia chinensis]|uniref:Uncharacterized protein n=1 Tax=Tupaia chinensis TaxID=246437 RepID=L9L709_TUPCH|nr:hypothetical protein TREES_T100002568 [Tupaia chinensis]